MTEPGREAPRRAVTGTDVESSAAPVVWWRRPVWVSRQTGTALAAAAAFVISALVATLVPVPYVVWGPGRTADTLGQVAPGETAVAISGTPTYPTTGALDLTTVSVTRVDSHVGLVEALAAFLRPGYDTLDRSLYYPDGLTEEQNEQQNAELMTESQSEALVAALRQLDRPVAEQVLVTAVLTDGPARGVLRPGDAITAVAGRAVPGGVDAVAAAILSAPGTAPLTVTVDRAGTAETVQLTPRPGADLPGRLGIVLGVGYDTQGVDVRYGIDEAIGGPSAGLVFSVAIYDMLTPGDLLAGRHVAGTGTIDDDGRVGPIGGIQSKIEGAEAAGASVFLVPGPNCVDLAGVDTGLDLIRVDTLADAVTALSTDDPEALKRC